MSIISPDAASRVFGQYDTGRCLRGKKKEYKKNNMAATNLYKCYKCGERKCQVMQMQTRSADEPMTNFVTCLVCHNNFKR